jgi:putative peptidoglycan lipid II flippase
MQSSISSATEHPGSAQAASAKLRQRSQRRLLLSFVAVFAARGLGMVLGLAVAVLLANRLGATTSTDAFFLARRLTLGASDAIRRVIANGYIPLVVADLRACGARAALLLWRRRFGQVLVAALLAAILVAVGAPLLVTVIAPGFSPETAAEAAFLLRILAFMIPISLTLAAMATFLLASRRFGLPEVLCELPRVLTVCTLLILVPPFGVTVLALALLLGAAFAAISLILVVRRHVRGKLEAGESTRGAPPRRQTGRVLPDVLMQTYSQASLWIAFGFASLLGAGSLSVLEYGIRLTTLLPSVLVTSFASIAYTELAHRSDDAGTRLAGSVMRSLRAAMFVALPLLVFIAVAAEALVDLVLRHGVFDHASAAETVAVIRCYSPAVAVGVMTNVLLIGIYADPQAPHLRVAMSAAVTGLVLRAGAMAIAIEMFGLVGVPLGASFADAAVLIMVGILVTRYWPGFLSRRDLLVLAAIALAAAAAGGSAYLVLHAVSIPEGSILPRIVALAGAGAAAVATYLAVAVLLRIPEVQLLRNQLPLGGRKRHDAAPS